MSSSESDSLVSDTARKFESDQKNEDENKIDAIWQQIEKTKNIEVNDEETYEMYRNKRIDQKQNNQGGKKCQSQFPKKIIDHLKAKRAKQPTTQLKRKSSNQNQNISSSEYKRNEGVSYYKELEFKLQKSKQNTNILMKKLIQAQEQIEYLEYELEKQMTQKDQLVVQLQRRTQRNPYGKQNRLINSNIREQKQTESKLLIEKYQLRLKAAQREIQQKNNQIYHTQSQLHKLNTEMQNYKLKLNDSQLTKVVFKGSELLELNQAYKTIERLVALLRSTEEYRLLGNFAEEIKNIHFLNKIPKQIKSELSNIKIYNKNKDRHATCSCTEIKINQRLLWTPLLCYKKMLEMKIKYDSLSQDCIEEVLFEMNKLYLSKEQARVNKLKINYDSEIQKLKKKTQLTYDEILAKKQIQRLKKQLHTSKNKQNKSNKKHTFSHLNQKNQITSIPHLKNLRAIGQYEDEIRVKDKQIKLLMQRIKMLQNQTGSYDKSLYMEGILWIIDKVLEQLDENNDSIREFENKFRAKIESATSTEDWIKLFKQFFQSIQEINHSLIDKILTIKQTTINKISYAKIS